MNRIVRIILGVFLIGWGVISFFLPLSPGWVFVLAGLALLGSKSAEAAFRKAHKKAAGWFGPKAGRLFLMPLAHLEKRPDESVFEEAIRCKDKRPKNRR